MIPVILIDATNSMCKMYYDPGHDHSICSEFESRFDMQILCFFGAPIFFV